MAEEAGRFLSTRFKYIKFSGEYRRFHKFEPGRVFAWRFLIASMGPIRGSNVTPVEERFFSGGSYSVRGWGRQLLGPLNVDTRIDTLDNMEIDTVRSVVPVGGNSIIEGSFEFRSTIYKKLSGALFLDYGNVWENSDGYDLFDLRYALGVGLRYNTFIGPIRVDFAWKLNPQPLDEDRFQLHVSIGHAF
ncbi:BamA/TamA family outer membrane protein [candidate division KSB1 bacterium]|nr:BamA/TamA family outer membrane protein [candidate division KSB1 bacterium]NIR71741.1 BamA/TamA family outer membrane protein [candidate division KSB1 bacterium]